MNVKELASAVFLQIYNPFFKFTIGTSRRKCLDKGVWDYPDYSQCTTKEFNQLKEKVCILTYSAVFLSLMI